MGAVLFILVLLCLCVFIAACLMGGYVLYKRTRPVTPTDAPNLPDPSVVVGAVLEASKDPTLTPAEEAAIDKGLAEGAAQVPKPTPAPTPTPTPTPATNPVTPIPATVPISAAQNAINLIKENKNVAIGVGAQVAIALAVKAAMKVVLKRTEASLAKFTVKLAVTALRKIGVKLSTTILSRLGVKAAVTIGTKLAAGRAVAAATGPAAPFVNAAILCFDVLSIGLDLGDPGGYSAMGTKKAYADIKKGVDAELKKVFEEQGVPFPKTIGPLDKLTDADMQTLIDKEVTRILQQPNSKYLQPFMAALQVYTQQNPSASENDISIWAENHMTQNPIDIDAVTLEAMTATCTANQGKMDGESCMWGSKASCLSSYSWPLGEDDTYSEWVDGKCVVASQGLRGICEQNNLTYNQDTHTCDVTDTYCKSKGGNWRYSEELKDYDCTVGAGQSIAEAIFGTTIVRGLKQIFDTAQYEVCKPGEIDDGYFCRRTLCGDDKVADASLCYPKCKDGYSGVGPVCYSNCPDGWTDDGAFCRRSNYCEADKDRNGNLCYPKCNAGYSGVGPVCYSNCPEGWTDDGAFCRRSNYCGADKDRNGNLCYPKCNAGYSGTGPVCYEQCEAGFTDDGAFCRRSGYCAPDQDRNGALCYPKCRAGYYGVGPVCWQSCPDGYKDDGLFCRRDAHIYGKGCCKTIFGCKWSCPEGYITDPCTCRRNAHIFAKGSYTRGAGTPDTLIKAKASYTRGAGTPDVEVKAKASYTRGAGTPDVVVKAKESYGRGVGTPSTVKVRAKKRVVPFGTKDN